MATIEYKIVPHLWFDTEARLAAEFHTTVFDNSRIISTVMR
ncbi:3-demethylubiquinone-9 3-methyltransferase [Nitrosomonas marina]|uniref:3-demethylubiquinone-9 3-methyltransferase n=1 Tax=Nitrosomonas marina TaxID=917 RepID=A0A1I0C876_9PROT|nr:VOC family protein [Nitrosomonas marina]SET15154.1 3-demethylubiquinone-9 3-methyltransferase [Nitrosomonas marina]